MNDSEGSYNEVEEEGEQDEFFDVLDILDGRADPFNDDEPSVTPPLKNETLHPPKEGEEDQEVDDDGNDHKMDTEADQLTPSDDDADVDALHNLGQFISNLDSSAKRKNSEDEGITAVENNVPRKKRKLLKEHNEAGAENEFAASGKLGFGHHSIPSLSDASVPQVRPNSILRTFSLPSWASRTT